MFDVSAFTRLSSIWNPQNTSFGHLQPKKSPVRVSYGRINTEFCDLRIRKRGEKHIIYKDSSYRKGGFAFLRDNRVSDIIFTAKSPNPAPACPGGWTRSLSTLIPSRASPNDCTNKTKRLQLGNCVKYCFPCFTRQPCFHTFLTSSQRPLRLHTERLDCSHLQFLLELALDK